MKGAVMNILDDMLDPGFQGPMRAVLLVTEGDHYVGALVRIGMTAGDDTVPSFPTREAACAAILGRQVAVSIYPRRDRRTASSPNARRAEAAP